MSHIASHLILVPVMLPMLAGAVMLLLGGEQRRNVKAAINVLSTLALVGVAAGLLRASAMAPVSTSFSIVLFPGST